MLKRTVWLLLLSVALLDSADTARDQECNDILQHALAARNPDTRKQAVIALSLAASRGPLMTTLEKMLDDKDLEVKLAVVASLAEVSTPASTAVLKRALDDDMPEVSYAAAKALWSRHDRAGKQALLSVLQGESKTASDYFTTQKREALRMMHTPRTTFLYALRQGVGFAPVPGLGEGIASMQALLTDSGVSGRATAALLLGKDKDPDTLAALKEALYDKDWHVRAAAVHSIALRNELAQQKDIETLLADDREEVRLRAAAGYLRLSSLRVRPAVQKQAAASH
jgi:HEAT repeat protein